MGKKPRWTPIEELLKKADKKYVPEDHTELLDEIDRLVAEADALLAEDNVVYVDFKNKKKCI